MESIKNLHEIASMLDPEILVSPPRLVDVSKYASTNTTVEVSFTVSIPPEKGVKPLPQWLIEAARAEEDERLGLWRYNENITCRRLGELLEVVNALTGDYRTYGLLTGRRYGLDDYDLGDCDLDDAARAYFAAHPEPEPWRNAKPGEVWAVSLNESQDEELLYRHGDGMFHFRDGDVLPSRLAITAARRIWPEESS